jgi:ankyrin repeat protein
LSQNGETALSFASAKGNGPLVEALLKAGANIDAQDYVLSFSAILSAHFFSRVEDRHFIWHPEEQTLESSSSYYVAVRIQISKMRWVRPPLPFHLLLS